MRLNTIKLLTLSLVAALFMVSTISFATQHRAFPVQLIVYDSNTGRDTVYFGVSYNPNATYCIDNTDTVTLPQFGAVKSEYEVPPYPVDGIFDLRFLDSRSGNGICLGNGEKNNFQAGSTTVAVSDTFKFHFLGSAPAGGAYPFFLAWNLPDTNHVTLTKCVLKYISPDPDTGGTKTVNMLTSSSIEFDDNNIISVTFICTSILKTDTTGVRQTSNVVPERFALNQNYPNPFNPTTTITFSIQNISDATIEVFDVLGRKVKTLVSDHLLPGSYSTTWNGQTEDGIAAASGTYYVRMNARYQKLGGANDQFVSVQKVLLMK